VLGEFRPVKAETVFHPYGTPLSAAAVEALPLSIDRSMHDLIVEVCSSGIIEAASLSRVDGADSAEFPPRLRVERDSLDRDLLSDDAMDQSGSDTSEVSPGQPAGLLVSPVDRPRPQGARLVFAVLVPRPSSPTANIFHPPR
jgi:hypothetical protein